MKNLHVDAMCNAVKEVVSLCGIEVLADASKFQAAIRDFLSNNSLYKTEQQTLAFAVRIGIGEVLLKGIDLSTSEQNRIITIADRILIDEYGFQKNRSDDILTAFASALGWQNIRLPKDTSSTLVKEQNNPNTGNKRKEMITGGQIISFGKYEWRVLFVKNSTALLISDEITDVGIPFNSDYKDVTWETSSIRDWLHTQFFNRFSHSEKNRIVTKRLQAESNQWYGTDAGCPTEDSVFLLSISEIVRNFGDSGSLKNRPENTWVLDGQPYAIDDGFNAARCATYKGEKTWWWLRSPGASMSKVAYVNAAGIIFLNGELAFDDGGTSCVGVRPGVRPAIWIRI